MYITTRLFHLIVIAFDIRGGGGGGGGVYEEEKRETGVLEVSFS